MHVHIFHICWRTPSVRSTSLDSSVSSMHPSAHWLLSVSKAQGWSSLKVLWHLRSATDGSTLHKSYVRTAMFADVFLILVQRHCRCTEYYRENARASLPYLCWTRRFLLQEHYLPGSHLWKQTRTTWRKFNFPFPNNLQIKLLWLFGHMAFKKWFYTLSLWFVVVSEWPTSSLIWYKTFHDFIHLYRPEAGAGNLKGAIFLTQGIFCHIMFCKFQTNQM